MKSKLGYLCSSESWGGLEMNHLRNAKWMSQRGHDVFVLCVANSPIEKTAIDFSLPIIHIEKHKKYFDFKNARILSAIIEENSISHLIIRSTRDMSITASVKRKLGKKLHTSYFMEMQLGVKKTNLLHTLRFKYIDLWSSPLNWLHAQVKDLTNFKNTSVVIPSGVDLNDFKNLPSQAEARALLELPKEKLIFGLIGRFDAQKGQLLLLEAMQKSASREYCVVLLGEPTLHEGEEYFDRMNQIIRENSLGKRVFLREYRSDTSTFYSAIDWMVMATKAETFGMVTVESLICGTPVLGSNAGGTPEILEQTRGGVLFETLNATDLAVKIDEILDQAISFDQNDLKAMSKIYDHTKVCESVELALGLSK
jgi:D-inositol-3-phosphate glycosyltransferase